tara:strand:- start:157 stop:1482 length:1326 start_codon:yes stop_codon:yes gene_type:complete
MENNKQICVMGMGYVGLTLSVILAEIGYDVFGIDVNKEIIKKLRDGQPHFYEKNLAVRLKQQLISRRLRFFCKAPKQDYHIIMIAVATPLKEGSKIPNLNYLNNVLDDVVEIIRPETLVCVRSTVPVGVTKTKIMTFIERKTGLIVGKSFFLAFTPERTVEGRALEELRENSQIVGGITKICTEKAANLFLNITPTVVTVSSTEVAEFSKIIDNCYRDLRFSFSNEMALVSENIGVDFYEVLNAANIHYPRNDIPVPSPGVGGTCLSKDPHILINLSKKAGYQPKLISEARKINEKYPGIIIEKIQHKYEQFGSNFNQSTILIAGFAFKGNPETADIRDSTSLSLLREIRSRSSCTIKGYDVIVDDSELRAIGVEPVTLPSGFDNIDILIIANNHESYRDWDISELLSKMNKPSIIYDGWRMLNNKTVNMFEKVLYLSPGL